MPSVLTAQKVRCVHASYSRLYIGKPRQAKLKCHIVNVDVVHLTCPLPNLLSAQPCKKILSNSHS